MAVDPDTTTVATGGGALGVLGLVGTWLWRKMSNDRHTMRLASEAKKAADEAKAHVAELRADLNLALTKMSGDIQSVREQGTRNEAGILGVKASIDTMNAAASADRTATAGILGEINGMLKAYGFDRRVGDNRGVGQ